MADEVCYWVLCASFCFERPDAALTQSIFGFSEFVQAIALAAVLYLVADVRYRFRLAIASNYLFPLTFAVIGVIGLGTLLSAVWVAQGWFVPQTAGLSQSVMQAIFGVLFLVTFLVWMYYAFIRPPIFGKRNAERYANVLFQRIATGNTTELPILADELNRSAESLIRLCRRTLPRTARSKNEEQEPIVADAGQYAYETLLLIGNRKFCRYLVNSAPGTAAVIFEAASEQKRYDVPITQFAVSVSTEAIANKDSVLYHEDDGFRSGLIGYIKPWSKAIYGDYELVSALAAAYGSPLDIDYQARWSWDADQWKAYSRVVLITLESHLQSGWRQMHSFALYRAFSDMEDTFRDIYRFDTSQPEWHRNDLYARLRVGVDFIDEVIKLLDKHYRAPNFLRARAGQHQHDDIYDWLAKYAFEIIDAVAGLKGSSDTTWSIHYGAVWGEIFGLQDATKSRRAVQFKLCRKLYDEVSDIGEMPNFKNAKILGYLLNIFGLSKRPHPKGDRRRATYSLQRAVQSIAARHYLALRAQEPAVASAALVGGIGFDEKSQRLVKTYASWLGHEGTKEFLELAAAEVSSESAPPKDPQ